jgi:hypothetical protein
MNVLFSLQALVQSRLVLAAHDVSDGGILVAVLEMAFAAHPCSLHLCFTSKQALISWDIQGLLKVLLGPTMPYHSTPCGRPPLKWLYDRMAVLLPLLIPHILRT